MIGFSQLNNDTDKFKHPLYIYQILSEFAPPFDWAWTRFFVKFSIDSINGLHIYLSRKCVFVIGVCGQARGLAVGYKLSGPGG